MRRSPADEMIPHNVRAVVFDAVGTVLIPSPSAIHTYHQVAVKHGSASTREQIQQRFKQAFQAEELLDQNQAHRTSEEREVERWRRIVSHCLTDVDNLELCFQELYQHFASPKGWATAGGIGSALTELCRRDYVLALGSNYDHRLRSVVAGTPELQAIQHLIISAEVGWKKPAGQFFQAVVEALHFAPTEILFIGDDRVNDYEGAKQAGLPALLYDVNNATPEVSSRITTFDQLL